MARQGFEQLSIPRRLGVLEKLRQLAKMLATEKGLARVNVYDAVNIAITEAIERRTANNEGKT